MSHICFWLSHTSTNTTFLSKATDYFFSHASAEVRGENTPERKVATIVDRTHNHQVMSQTRSPLSHPGGASSMYMRGVAQVIRVIRVIRVIQRVQRVQRRELAQVIQVIRVIRVIQRVQRVQRRELAQVIQVIRVIRVRGTGTVH